MRYRSFYPHGNYLEIVAGLPINEITGNASDLRIAAESPEAPLRNIRLSINKLLCLALKGDFHGKNEKGESEVKNFATAKNGLYMKNLSAWTVGSVYMGLETQAVFFDETKDADKYFYPPTDPRYGAHDVRQDIKDRMINNNEFYKGDVELVAHVSEVSLKAAAEPYTQLNTCDDVDKLYSTGKPNDDIVNRQVCTPNSVTAEGCSPMANGSNKRTCNTSGTGYGACSLTCNSGYHLENGSCVANTTAQSCTFGTNIAEASKSAFEWMCNCTAANPIYSKTGWVSQGGGCYHRVANSFCSASRIKVYWVCDQPQAPSGSGWVPQPDGCYHWSSGQTCN